LSLCKNLKSITLIIFIRKIIYIFLACSIIIILDFYCSICWQSRIIFFYVIKFISKIITVIRIYWMSVENIFVWKIFIVRNKLFLSKILFYKFQTSESLKFLKILIIYIVLVKFNPSQFDFILFNSLVLTRIQWLIHIEIIFLIVLLRTW
jgi:hypothetical protein